MELYTSKEKKYFSNPRLDLINLIPNKCNNKVLELGAGGGDTLIELKKRNIASETTGIELTHLENTNQSHPSIDKLIFGNIETMDLDLPSDYFDVILCGDVIEHLVDPWHTLNKLHKHLKPDGVLITSIPNIREYATMYKVFIKGNFEYEESGILDKTHLRFFCKKNIISLLKETNFEPLTVVTSFDANNVPSKRKTLNQLTLRLFEEFLALQYIVVSKKKPLA